MQFLLTDPTDVPADLYAAAAEYARAVIAERHPELELRGVVGDLVVNMHALLAAAYIDSAERAVRSASIADISVSPDLADPAIVDRVLSNSRVERLPATAASGVVRVVLNDALATTVPRGSRFIIQQAEYEASESVAVRPGEGLIAGQNGRWSFEVPVVAVAAGVGPQVRLGAPVTVVASPPSFHSAEASVDFSDGRQADTTRELVERMRLGQAARAWSSRDSIAALLQEAGILRLGGAVSCVGVGDEEMTRDWTGYPLSRGGACDVFLKARPGTTRRQISVSANQNGLVTLAPGQTDGLVNVVGATDRHGNVQISGWSRYSGSVAGIKPPSGVGSSSGSAYGAFQGVQVQLPRKSYDDSLVLTIEESPGVLAAQALLSHPSRRPVGGDVHVRAAIPFHVGGDIKLQGSGVTEELERRLTAEMARYISTIGFEEPIFVTKVSEQLSKVLPTDVKVASIVLRGVVTAPDGSIFRAVSSSVLEVPSKPEHGVTSLTSAPNCNAEDIGVTTV